MKSDTIGQLAAALAKAQGEMKNAAKDKANPFFKSSYADLASVWEACREPLSKNGLSVTQSLNMGEKGLILTSILMHASGEFITSTLPVTPAKQDAQGIGAAITYMRRFALSALVGVAPSEKASEHENLDDSDDDGESAVGRGPKPEWHPSHAETEYIKSQLPLIGWEPSHISQFIKSKFSPKEMLGHLDRKEYETLIGYMDKQPKIVK